ncbi:MAG TPA: helix-turn-helix transcriptional regulator [Thermomicrobiales bacterium]|nr:helix-turn-helix transcriptional regulator [Thermomicrobiales bacterium]
MAPTDGRQPPAHPEFGPLLTELRLARGMAQRALAVTSDADASTISRIEKGERGVSRELVERLADALAATPEERLRLLRAAGFLPPLVESLLAEPELAMLTALFKRSDLEERHRTLLLDYVRLALAHARALGYDPPDPWEA